MAAARSGQITVTTAGTAVIGTATAKFYGFYVRALSTNTGKVYVGNDGAGDVTSGNGYELSPGDDIYIECANLSELYFDSATNGDKFCWIAVHEIKNVV
jgi:hypothetical protein